MKNTITTLTLLIGASFLISTEANAVQVTCSGGKSASLTGGVYTCTKADGTKTTTPCKYGAPSTQSTWSGKTSGTCTPSATVSCIASC